MDTTIRQAITIITAAAVNMTLGSQAGASPSQAEKFDDPAIREWVMVGGGWSNTRYSGLTQINMSNIEGLGAAWVSEAFGDGATSTVTPVVQNGVMFVTAGPKVHALNAKTGT